MVPNRLLGNCLYERKESVCELIESFCIFDVGLAFRQETEARRVTSIDIHLIQFRQSVFFQFYHIIHLRIEHDQIVAFGRVQAFGFDQRF